MVRKKIFAYGIFEEEVSGKILDKIDGFYQDSEESVE